MVDTYETLSQEFDSLMGANSLRAIAKEDFRRVDELPDVSKAGMEAYADACENLSRRISSAESVGETLDERIDLEVATAELLAQKIDTVGQIGHAPRYAVNPFIFTPFAETLVFYLERDPREPRERVDGLVRKLNQVPTFLKQGLSRLDRPVEIWRDMECETVAGFNDMQMAIYSFAEQCGYQDIAAMNDALGVAGAAVKEYHEKLAAMPTRRNLSLGLEVTCKLFENRGIEVSLEDMHNLATKDIGERKERLEKLRREVIDKYHFPRESSTNDVQRLLKQATACPEGKAVQVAEEILKEATRFAYEQGIVQPLQGDHQARIAFTPSYLRSTIPVAAMNPPGSFAEGTKRSVYFITERVGNIMSRPALAGTVAHELIPGHHYQGVRATQHPSRIRGWLFPLDLIEGWTTRVAEQVMLERGYEATPGFGLEERFFGEAGQLRLGARVYFALACLTGERGFLENPYSTGNEALDIIHASERMYQEITGFPASRANADVHLFSSLQGYAPLYLIGNVLFHRMEGQARKKQGSQFHLADFHEAMLNEGTLPLSAMQRSLEQKGMM